MKDSKKTATLLRIALCSFFCLGLVGFCLNQAYATPVTIVNPSFENPNLSDGQWTDAGIPILGWVMSLIPNQPYLTVGVLNPTNTSLFNVPDGQNVAYIRRGSLTQTLGTTFQSDTVYTLSVQVGNRTETPLNNYWIELLAGDTVISRSDNPVSPSDGYFSLAVQTYTFQASHLGLVGRSLGIRLSGTDIAGGYYPQTAFDMVTLDAATAVPEPTTILLLGSGLMGLAGFRRVRGVIHR